MKLLPKGVADVACGDAHTLVLMQDGSLFAMGRNHAGQLGNGTTQTSYQPVKVRDNGVVSISAYGSYSLFVMEDGTAWHMGKHESRYSRKLWMRLEPGG